MSNKLKNIRYSCHRNAIAALLAAIGLLTFTGCSATQAAKSTPVASTPTHVPVGDWSTIEVESQPAGAAIFVNGQQYGYAPLSFQVKTYDGEMRDSVYVTAVPTLPGEFSQSGWIGPIFGASGKPPGGIQFFMYQPPVQ